MGLPALRVKTILGRWLLIAAICPVGAVEARAQAPAVSWEQYRLDSARWVDDSTRIAAAARTVPSDSLRRLYRALVSTRQPARVVDEMMCESYRLRFVYGRAASVAEDRIQAEEWPERRKVDVDRALDAWRETLPIGSASRPRPDTLPLMATMGTRERCLPAAEQRSVFGETSFRPIPPDAPKPGTLEWYRRYRGSAEGTIRGRDSLLRDAYASLEWRTPQTLVLEIRDLKTNFGVTFSRSGPEFLRPGVYPVYSGEAPVGTNNVMIMSSVGPGRTTGTLTIDRADTLGVEGRIEVIHHRNSPTYRQWMLPPDSIFDIPISIRFRALYQYPDDQSRHLWGVPVYPHPWNPRPIADPDEVLMNPRFRDEKVRCQDLPIYRRESVVVPLLRSSPVNSVTGAIEVSVDSLGRAGSILLLAVSDTSQRREFANQTGLRFDPPQATGEHRFSVVRCTLTLRRP